MARLAAGLGAVCAVGGPGCVPRSWLSGANPARAAASGRSSVRSSGRHPSGVAVMTGPMAGMARRTPVWSHPSGLARHVVGEARHPHVITAVHGQPPLAHVNPARSVSLPCPCSRALPPPHPTSPETGSRRLRQLFGFSRADARPAPCSPTISEPQVVSAGASATDRPAPRQIRRPYPTTTFLDHTRGEGRTGAAKQSCLPLLAPGMDERLAFA